MEIEWYWSLLFILIREKNMETFEKFTLSKVHKKLLEKWKYKVYKIHMDD